MAIPCTLSIDKVQASISREIDVSTGTHSTPDSTLASNMTHMDLRNCGSGLKDSRPPPEEDSKPRPNRMQGHSTAPNGYTGTLIIEGGEGVVMEPARNGNAEKESNSSSNKFGISGRENEIRNGRDGKTLLKENTEYTQKLRRSLFDLLEYPAPWPLIPSSQERWQYLEHQLNHRSLPTTLIAHDPCDTFAVNSCNELGEAKEEPYGAWMEHEDIGHTCDLRLTLEAQARVTDEESKDLASSAASPNTSQNNTLRGQKTVNESDILMFREWTDTGVKITLNSKINELPGYGFCLKTSHPGPIYPPPVIIFECPLLEPQSTNPAPPKIETAHLYINPTSWIGYGHHSSIVDAELEIPCSAIARLDNTDY
ncbi:hypothetical protein BDZ94DRAFT_1326657 [Collybia nuda]|uniref:Uncharacterized protein n=1 Tax=Collybia nuda TaxID=64659 RepID=A0A9P6CC95_9AGAR|nr:hypothetical protein BDZ94DRAFT_1326657 [Collybia nuda]